MKTQHRAGLIRAVLLPSVLASGLMLVSACASTPRAPTSSLTEAREAIAHAEQSDGRQYAGSELDNAKQKLGMAQRAVDNQDMVQAERMAREARVTAELASATAAAAKAAEVNREMERSAEALTEEMRRTGEQR